MRGVHGSLATTFAAATQPATKPATKPPAVIALRGEGAYAIAGASQRNSLETIKHSSTKMAGDGKGFSKLYPTRRKTRGGTGANAFAASNAAA